MEDWIKVIAFTLPHEAHMAKALLEASGIDVIIVDELTVQVYNLYSNAIGGVKLYVEEGNVEEALILLEDGGYIVKNHPEEKEREMFSHKYEKKCPYCDSENVMRKNMPGYIYVFSILLFSFPLPFIKRIHYCYDCQKEWKVDKNKS